MKMIFLAVILLTSQIALGAEPGAPERKIPGYGKPCLGQVGEVHANGGGFVAYGARVDASVFVGPKATVCDFAIVTGNVKIEGNTTVTDHAEVSGHAYISDASIQGNAKVYGHAYINGMGKTAVIYGNARVYGIAHIGFNTSVGGYDPVICRGYYGRPDLKPWQALSIQWGDYCNDDDNVRQDDATYFPVEVSDGARDNSAPSYEPQSINTRKNNNAGISR